MGQVTIITDDVHSVEGSTVEGRVLVEPDRLADALGWALKPEGLCQGDSCVPVPDVGALHVDGRLDVAAVAGALGRVVVVDADAGLAAMALPSEQRHRALDGLQAPDFVLDDLDGSPHGLDEWRGLKKLVVAFSTW